MSIPRKHRLSLQDLLAALTFAAVAIWLTTFLASRSGGHDTSAAKYIAAGALFGLPASIGAAFGCLVVGWRRSWKGAILAIAIAACCVVAGAFLFGGLAPR